MPPADRLTVLRLLLESSGLTAQAFARDVLGRDPRTLRRWLSGEVEIPDAASDWLTRLERIRTTPAKVSLRVKRS